jgi:hypothetical protein
VAKAGAAGSSWQREADLLAEGRVYLERLCNRTRFRHLFPGGPNLALLLLAYQDLERQRTVGRIAPEKLRHARRFLRRSLQRRVADDVIERSLRLAYRIPPARQRPVLADLPPLVERALEAVDAAVRDDVRAHILGRDDKAPLEIGASQPTLSPAVARGLGQLREGLVYQAFAHPSEVGPILTVSFSSLPVKANGHW